MQERFVGKWDIYPTRSITLVLSTIDLRVLEEAR